MKINQMIGRQRKCS